MSLYTLLKIFHISCVVISIVGFTWRGVLKLSGSNLLQKKIFKILPHVVDTLLLASAISLVVMSGMYPWVAGWVGAKLLALIVYVVAGSIFMRSQQSQSRQFFWFAISVLAVGYIVAVALTKSPLPGL